MTKLLVLGVILFVSSPALAQDVPTTFSFSLHAYDNGAEFSGTMPDGQKVEGSVTARPYDGGADVDLRYNDGRRRECQATVAPLNGTISATCH